MHPHLQGVQNWAVPGHSQVVWGVPGVQGLETEGLCWSWLAVLELLVAPILPFCLL